MKEVIDSFKAELFRSLVMNNYTKDMCVTNKGSKSQTNKEKWIQHYANHIFKLWMQWQTSLGVSCEYLEQLKSDLAIFYEKPLKRKFIETTY